MTAVTIGEKNSSNDSNRGEGVGEGGEGVDGVRFSDSAQWKGMSVFCQRKRGRKAAGGGGGRLWVAFSCRPGSQVAVHAPTSAAFQLSPSPPHPPLHPPARRCQGQR